MLAPFISMGSAAYIPTIIFLYCQRSNAYLYTITATVASQSENESVSIYSVESQHINQYQQYTFDKEGSRSSEGVDLIITSDSMYDCDTLVSLSLIICII